MSPWQHLAEHISLHTGQHFQITAHSAMGGGCINEAYRVSDAQKHYFVKFNTLNQLDMFAAEALSLEELFKYGTVRVPRPICYGQTDTQSYIVLEYLALSGQPDATLFGQQMAAMHQISSKQHGWIRHNSIGSTPQKNSLMHNWIDFWREQRLAPQLKLAEKNGYGQALTPLTDRLLTDFDCLFDNYTPQPSMLHGDLWAGNAAALADSTPVIFDPAFYYGDRETDIAMSYLFGGFEQGFYNAYNEAWPLDSGFALRKTFYNLYHILNHLNLFGPAYLAQAISMSKQVLAEI